MRSYTHYHGVRNAKSREWKKAWKQLIQDIPLIIERAGIPLQGPPPSPAPPMQSADSEQRHNILPVSPPLIDLKKGIYINGVEPNSCDPLCLHPDGTSWSVKTASKPYDIVVSCVLLRAFLLAPHQFALGSDGDWEESGEWDAALELYRDLWPHDSVWCPWGDEGPQEKDEDDREHGGVGFFVALKKQFSGVVTLLYESNYG